MVAGLAVEPHRSQYRAVGGWAGLEPVGEPVLVDEVDGAGGLAAVGGEEGGEIGHRPRLEFVPLAWKTAPNVAVGRGRRQWGRLRSGC